MFFQSESDFIVYIIDFKIVLRNKLL